MILKKAHLVVVLFLISFSISAKGIDNTATFYHYEGRVDHLKDGNTMLVGAASSVTFEFTDKNCEIFLQSVDTWEHHNYVVFELDGIYLGRFAIKKGSPKSFPIISTTHEKTHRLTIYKATEAANGGVLFSGTDANLVKFSPQKRKKIEFIGDSITCGMGNDSSLFPCDKGEWFDHHNAYMAYGPQVARRLDADFVLSSVSGIGMYRNWNDEHQKESIMPDVYENLYLNEDSSKKYNFKFEPDLVSICLGTNDLSDGDGKKYRMLFDESKFEKNYIEFIKTVYKHYPDTRIVLLNSPMVSGARNDAFVGCLKNIIAAFANDKKHEPIQLFEFQPMTPSGCGSHPDSFDHTIMENQLTPFIKKILDEN